MMFEVHFDNDSVLLNPVAAAYVHLATSSVTMTVKVRLVYHLEPLHQYRRKTRYLVLKTPAK